MRGGRSRAADPGRSRRGAAPSAGTPRRCSPSARRPACRWGSRGPPPGRRRPTGRPARTSSAGRSAWSMLTTGRPATMPAKTTTPVARRPAPAHPACAGQVDAAVAGARTAWAARRTAGSTVSGPGSGAVQTRDRDRAGARARRRGAVDSRPVATTASTQQRGRSRRCACSDRRRRRAGGQGDRGICGRAATAGESRRGRSRMLSGAARSDGSTSRVLLPPQRRGSRHLGPSGQPPGAWRRRTPGRRTTRCPRQPRSAATGRAHRERRPWQSSA